MKLIEKKLSVTYALTSSVASFPTMCLMAVSPPGWNLTQSSSLSTLLSTMIINLSSDIMPSISALDRTWRLLEVDIFVKIDKSETEFYQNLGDMGGNQLRLRKK